MIMGTCVSGGTTRLLGFHKSRTHRESSDKEKSLQTSEPKMVQVYGLLQGGEAPLVKASSIFF